MRTIRASPNGPDSKPNPVSVLSILPQTQLSLCFTFADIAEAERNRGDYQHAQFAAANAEKGYTTIQGFFADPKHAELVTDEEHRELTAGTGRLRKQLDDLNW